MICFHSSLVTFRPVGYFLFAGPLRKRLPEDFERLRFWFPLIDLEILRHEGGKDGE